MNLFGLFIATSFFFVVTTNAAAQNVGSEMETFLRDLVRQQHKASGLVSLGAVIIHNGTLVGPIAIGERKLKSQVTVTGEDLWHIGSITKSVTATMLARLVEKGTISWNTSIKDVFGENSDIDPAWYSVTLIELLSHTSGAPPNFPPWLQLKNPEEGAARMSARAAAVSNILRKPPIFNPGSDFIYSNVGYTIAGMIAEKLTGIPWEDLIRQEVFEPLKLTSGGFGAPQDHDGLLSQPRGHRNLLGFTFAAKPDSDNTPIMGPAGTIHLSLTDMATYGHEHLKGELGQGELLKEKTYRQLHTSHRNKYALGWVVDKDHEKANGAALWHNGSNTMWFALLVLLPEINAVVAIATNDGKVHLAQEHAWQMVVKIREKIEISGGETAQSSLRSP